MFSLRLIFILFFAFVLLLVPGSATPLPLPSRSSLRMHRRGLHFPFKCALYFLVSSNTERIAYLCYSPSALFVPPILCIFLCPISHSYSTTPCSIFSVERSTKRRGIFHIFIVCSSGRNKLCFSQTDSLIIC